MRKCCNYNCCNCKCVGPRGKRGKTGTFDDSNPLFNVTTSTTETGPTSFGPIDVYVGNELRVWSAGGLDTSVTEGSALINIEPNIILNGVTGPTEPPSDVTRGAIFYNTHALEYYTWDSINQEWILLNAGKFFGSGKSVGLSSDSFVFQTCPASNGANPGQFIVQGIDCIVIEANGTTTTSECIAGGFTSNVISRTSAGYQYIGLPAISGLTMSTYGRATLNGSTPTTFSVVIESFDGSTWNQMSVPYSATLNSTVTSENITVLGGVIGNMYRFPLRFKIYTEPSEFEESSSLSINLTLTIEAIA